MIKMSILTITCAIFCEVTDFGLWLTVTGRTRSSCSYFTPNFSGRKEPMRKRMLKVEEEGKQGIRKTRNKYEVFNDHL